MSVFTKHYLVPSLSVALIYALANVPLFIAGWFFISHRFFLYSIVGTLIFSAATMTSLRSSRRSPSSALSGPDVKACPDHPSSQNRVS